MSEWKEYKLGEIITFQRGYDLPKGDMVNGPIPVAGSNGIIGYHTKFTTKGPGITIGRSGNIGMAHYYPIDFWAHNTTLYVKDFKGNDPKFIYYLLKTIDFSQFNTGSAVPSLNRNHIHELVVSIPLLDEQKWIAEVLSSLDDKMDLMHRENATLEALAETLFRHYFIENTDPTWKEGKLGEFINIGSGKALKHNDFVNEGLYPVLGANGEIGRANEYIVNETDRVLYTGRVGTLGKVFRLEGERAWLSDNTLVIKPKCHFNYVYFLLKQANLQDLDVGSTQPLIRQSDVVDIDVIIPNDSIIDAFEKEVCPLFEKIKSNQQQIQTLAIQRDALLPRLMSGEVKISGQYNIGK